MLPIIPNYLSIHVLIIYLRESIKTLVILHIIYFNFVFNIFKCIF